MNKLEFLILNRAFRRVNLQELAFGSTFSHAEIARAAHGLFENGDILAEFDTKEGKKVQDVTLTMSLIQVHLDGNFHFMCYLTPQGGAKWEAATHADWNRYYQWFPHRRDNSQTPELRTAEIICADRKLLETRTRIAKHSQAMQFVAGTEVFSEVEPWQVNRWKTLPKAYKVRYQYRQLKKTVDPNVVDEPISTGEKANSWSSKEIDTWYTEPLFEETEPKFPRHYPIPKKINLEQIEYLILRKVIFGLADLRINRYSFDTNYQELSHGEIAIGADSLFQKGYIRAKVFAEGSDDRGIHYYEETPDVVLTMTGIQDHLDCYLRALYYLTPEGGEHWEAIARPDWNKLLIDDLNIICFPQPDKEPGIFATKRENIEQLLAYGEYLLEERQPIPGTEVWEVLEPWQVTYWKTLPRGYRLRYQYEEFDYQLQTKSDEEFDKYVSTETEIQAREWYKNINQWYDQPSFD